MQGILRISALEGCLCVVSGIQDATDIHGTFQCGGKVSFYPEKSRQWPRAGRSNEGED
jgi:hypothetical protein